jgi:hypothetical protein
MNAQLRRRVATSDQLVGQAHGLKHLERSRLNGEGTRLGNAICAAVDDADRHSPALERRREREAGRTGADHEHIAGAHAAIVADVAGYLELWRHTDNDGDALTDDGIEAALRIRADDEDRWPDIAGEADGNGLSAFRGVDAVFVEVEARQLGSALRRVLDRLDDGQRALLVGHSPTNEDAVSRTNWFLRYVGWQFPVRKEPFRAPRSARTRHWRLGRTSLLRATARYLVQRDAGGDTGVERLGGGVDRDAYQQIARASHQP